MTRTVTWTDGAPLTEDRAAHASAVVGGELMVAGGSRWPTPDQKLRLRRADAYDPRRDAWRSLPALPRTMDGATGVAAGGKFYVLGGYDGKETRPEILRLDGDSGWRQVASLPAPRTLAAAAVVDSRIYLACGTRVPDTLADDFPTLFVCDTGNGYRVTTARPFPGAARAVHAMTAAAGAVYLFGGARVTGGKVLNSREVWRYAPEDDRWERLPDAPTALRGASGVPLEEEGAILLLGGYRDDVPVPGAVRSIWCFGLRTGNWEESGELPLAVGVVGFGHDGRTLLGTGGEPGSKRRSARTLRGRVAG